MNMRRRRAVRWKWGSAAIEFRPALLLALMLCLVWYGGESSNVVDGPAPGQTRTATVVTTALNLRSGPSVGNDVVAVLGWGEVVKVTGETVRGFVPVERSGTTGWVADEYLADELADDREEEALPDAEAMQTRRSVGDDAPAAGSAETTNPLAPTVARPEERAERWIRIDRSDATVSLLEGDEVVAVLPGRIGRDPSRDGFFSTAVGRFRVYAMTRDLSPTPFAEDTWLTHWVGFDPVRKNGIHSPVRNEDGTVREWQNETTLGCVRLSAEDAVTVFDFATIGMRVDVVD